MWTGRRRNIADSRDIPPPLVLILVVALLLGACAAPRLQAPGDISVTPRLYENHAVMEDGYRLPLGHWLPDGRPLAVVLALHGFNDYHQAFAIVGEKLARHGMALYAYDQRGFGATAGRGLWHGTARLAEDARTLVFLLRRRYPGIPLYLMGESMGGAVAIVALTAVDAPPVAGAVLIAPAVWARNTMPWYQRLSLWLGAHIMPATRLTGASLKIRASDNEAMLRRLGEDPLVIHASRIDTLHGLADLMDRALAAAPRLTTPSLILYGLNDQVIPRKPVCRLLMKLPPQAPWRFVLYPQGYHMLTRDLDGARVVQDIMAWLEDPAASLPSGNERPRERLAQQVNPHCEPLWHTAMEGLRKTG